MRILIVDNHAGMRAIIRELFQRGNHDIMECTSGEEALDAARLFQPEWATIDMRLGRLNGITVLRVFHYQHPGTRCIILSSVEDPEIEATALEAGAEAVVSKENLSKLTALICKKSGETP